MIQWGKIGIKELVTSGKQAWANINKTLFLLFKNLISENEKMLVKNINDTI